MVGDSDDVDHPTDTDVLRAALPHGTAHGRTGIINALPKSQVTVAGKQVYS